jgi:hypothetical protein
MGGQCLHASDLDASPQVVRSAALTDEATRASKRSGGGEEGDEADWLVAQGVPLNAPEGSGETILAGFPQSTPETVEEEVGKQHGLEIVKRFTLESLERRIVVFRIPDARAVADVVAALKADQRVSSAQASVRYAAPKPQTPDTRISEPKRPPDPHAKQGKGRKGGVATRSPARPEEAPKTAQVARTAGPPPPPLRSRQQGSLVAGNQASLRFPTADEPFVNPGGKNK